MRYVHIFFIALQDVLVQRGRTFVWFLVSLWNPFIMLLFWRGVSDSHAFASSGWSYAAITSYYIFLTIFGSLTSSNIEEDIAKEDILRGNLARYILRPVSYFWVKFVEELPYRLVKALYGIIVFFVLFFLLGNIFVVSTSFVSYLLFSVMLFLAIFLGYVMKVSLGFLAFWVTDVRGILETFEVINIFLAGYLVPFFLAPDWLANIAYALPFPYIIYFPLISFEGKLTLIESLRVIGIQILWLGIFYMLYAMLWKKGVKKFSV